MAISRFEEIRHSRLDKLARLREMGIDPYPPKYSHSHISILDARSRSGQEVSVVGRLWRWREHGNVIFADLKDSSGTIQLLFQKKHLPRDFATLKLLDVGDFLGATGAVVTTQAGEITVDVASFELLTKSIRPLPDDWHGLKDEEARYRRRYVDLMLSDDLRDLFRRKSIFWNSMRSFMIQKGFLEVETPVLENVFGGADAAPFVTHHNALDIDLYLRISMGELWQKRLMVGGFEKTFEIGRQFRNEGISREHLQDYTQMEFYWAYANYEDSSSLVEEMYRHVARETFGTLKFNVSGFEVDLEKPWPRIDYSRTILEHAGFDITTGDISSLHSQLGKMNIPFSASDDRGRLIDLLWKSVRKNIGGPAFLVGHPVEVSPLAKRSPQNPEYVQRYQVILAGSEMGNGYSELNDPVDQAQRFQKQQDLRDSGDAEAQMYDHDFVDALEYGMPPVSGFGVSERLFSFLCDKPIRECVLFPLLRPEKPVSKVAVSENLSGYSVSPDVSARFPGMFYAFTRIIGVDIAKSSRELEAAQTEVLAQAQSSSLEELSGFGLIGQYRQLLKSTGIDPNKKRPSPEALLRRILQGKGIYHINTAVDAYNLAVIQTGVGLGGFDAARIARSVTLRLSQAGERVHLLGDEQESATAEGELVYSDEEKILTVDLNYRDINETKITESTRDIVLFADGAPDADRTQVLHALKQGAELIQRYCGGTIEPFIIVE